jgi:tRNA threonylcarbamoyladenosine biosynthesis protein TsaB
VFTAILSTGLIYIVSRMNCLVFDTSTSACTIALKASKGIFSFYQVAPRKHNTLMLPEIEKLLLQAHISVSELDYISYGVGPGSFVGVRLSAAITQGLALVNNIPVIPFSSMHAYAVSVFKAHKIPNISIVLDAKVNDLYVGDYQYNEKLGLLEILNESSVKTPNFQPSQMSELYAGDGCGLVLESLKGMKVITTPFFPNAKDMLPYIEQKMANNEYMDALDAQPVYLQGTENWKKI